MLFAIQGVLPPAKAPSAELGVLPKATAQLGFRQTPLVLTALVLGQLQLVAPVLVGLLPKAHVVVLEVHLDPRWISIYKFLIRICAMHLFINHFSRDNRSICILIIVMA